MIDRKIFMILQPEQFKHYIDFFNEVDKESLINAIDNEPTSIDELVSKTDMPVPRVLSTISVLEMRRLVRRLSGSKVARN